MISNDQQDSKVKMFNGSCLMLSAAYCDQFAKRLIKYLVIVSLLLMSTEMGCPKLVTFTDLT